VVPQRKPSPEGFSIGTVAGMTGLDPHTIRAWERRYGAVRPGRGARGMRRYGEAEVARLQLLKAVVDCGEAISTVAPLADDALRERLATLTEIASGNPLRDGAGVVSVALLAPGMAGQVEADAASLGRLEISLASNNLLELLTSLPSQPAQVVIAELRALGAEPLRALQAIRKASAVRLVVLLYEFAPAAELARLSRSGARLVRGPLRVAQLRRAVEDLLAIDAATARTQPPLPEVAEGGAAPRLLDDDRLARLLETSGGVQCECPSHLASLVTSVLAFERYSNDCESRNEEDAELHRRLALSSSRIRSEFEKLLLEVCRHEGLEA